MKQSFFSIAVIMIIASCLLTSCVTMYKTYEVSKVSDYTSEFVGKPHNQIVATLGAPDRQTPDGAGGTILIYEQTTTTSTSNSVDVAYNVNYFTKTYTPGTETNTVQSQNTSYVHLFINSNGVCYNVKTNHQKLVTEVDEEATAKNKKMWKIAGYTWGAAGVIIAIAGLVVGII